MGERVFPAFPAGIETRFQAVQMTAGVEPEGVRDYLSDPACPYSLVLKDVVRAYLLRGSAGLGGGGGNLAVAPLFQGLSSDQTDEDRAEGVLGEIQATINAMRNIERSLDVDDTDGKLNIIKQKTGLLEKWVQLTQAANGIRQVGEFQRLVIGALDKYMDKDQRAEFKKDLEKLLAGAKDE